MTMKPFADDSASITIGGLSAENGTDTIVLSGSLEITCDQAGLKQTRALRALIDAICQELEARDLPQHVKQGASTTEHVVNPFV